MSWLKRFRRNADPLDSELLRWSARDAYRVRDLLNGGLLVVSRSGGGKTSASGFRVSRAIVAHPKSCGLILIPKPEDVAMWHGVFAAAGRQQDLLVFDADKSPLRFNFLAEAAKHGSTREITRCMTTIGETLRAGDQRGRGEDSAFWERETERMIHNAVEVLKLARRAILAPEIQRFIVSAAFDRAQLHDTAWKAGFHCRCLNDAFDSEKTAMESHDFELAADYWLTEFVAMADRTRSSILTGALGLLHVFNTGLVRELVSTTSNVGTEIMLEKGKWVLVNTPPARFGDMGRLINAGWKYLTQLAVLRRQANTDDFFHVCWCDEAAEFVNSFDSHYVAQCRSHLGCLVFLAQSLPSFYSALKGENGHQAQALLANFSHRIFHALGDIETAQWASGLLGNRLEMLVGGSLQPATDIFDELVGFSRFSGSFSSHYEPVLQTGVFLNGLRTGGPRNDFLCDGILTRSGEPFASGENWIPVTFRQG